MNNINQGDDFSKKTDLNDSVNFREAFNKYIFHWPVFILGIVICFSVAILYLRYAQKIFLVKSTLLIKDEKKGGMAGSDLLNDLDLFGSSKVVDNEIEILKSKTLMRKVVTRLNLAVSLKSEGRFKTSDLYENKPVNVDAKNINEEWFGVPLLLSFPSSTTYLIKDEVSGKVFSGRLNEIQRNGVGTYKISPSVFFKNDRAPIILTFNDPQIVADQCLNRLLIVLTGKQSTVLTLSYEATVPKLGQDILNTLVQVYNEAALADKNRTTQSTIQFIDERLRLISGELTSVEKDVEGFKSSRGITDISNDANIFLESVKSNDAKLNEVNLQISVIKGVQRYVNTESSQEKLPSTLGINDPVLLTQINQLSELQLQRDQLLATTTENNPLVAPLIKQIETTRASIKAAIANILQSLEVSKRDLESNNNQFQSSIRQLPGQERQLVSIKRQQTIKESLYLYLLQKQEEAALSYASSVADSRTVDPAYYSKIPIAPKNQLILLAALMMGLILPVTYIYGKDLINNKVESAQDVVKFTSAPLLGEVLLSELPEPIVVLDDSRSAIAEQFRSIRTNMQFLRQTENGNLGRVTLFTSGMSGEGKTFVASNLAAAFSISGKRTVLLELDLRKPKVSRYLSLPNEVGFSNYQINKAGLEDIIRPSGINPNLFVIGSGPIPPNPSELLNQDKTETLINHLRTNFDEIIIDSPPIGLVTDAQILSRLADATIYIVRQNVTFKEQLKSIEQLYTGNKFPKLHVVLNGTKIGGRYGYGYGYGYGYYSENMKQSGVMSVVKNILSRF